MWPYSQHRLILIIDRESYWPYHKIDNNLNDKVCSNFTHTFLTDKKQNIFFETITGHKMSTEKRKQLSITRSIKTVMCHSVQLSYSNKYITLKTIFETISFHKNEC